MNVPRKVLVVGAGGYVGRHLVRNLRAMTSSEPVEVVAAVRPGSRTVPGAVPVADASAFDRLVGETEPFRVVCLPQLAGTDVDWLVDRIDGPRWLVFSSAQLAARASAPGAELARARQARAVGRGAAVLAPTMIFGGGQDSNISRIVRSVRSTRVPAFVGDGSQLVQPVHVDDICSLVAAHLWGDVGAGLYPAGGSEVLPVSELVGSIAELLGVRTPALGVPVAALRAGARFAPLVGLRPDQVMRLIEDKIVDDTLTRATFGWEPMPLAHRLEQAVYELDLLVDR